MNEVKINISELKSEGGDITKELAEFIKEKTKADVKTGADEITVRVDETTVPRTHLRVLLKKFLHRQNLKEDFRIIGGKESALIVKKIKIKEEEE